MKDSRPQDILENLFPGLDSTIISLVLDDQNQDVDAAADALLAMQDESRGSLSHSEVLALSRV